MELARYFLEEYYDSTETFFVISLIKRHTDTNVKKYLLFFIEVKSVKEKFIANMSLWHAALWRHDDVIVDE